MFKFLLLIGLEFFLSTTPVVEKDEPTQTENTIEEYVEEEQMSTFACPGPGVDVEHDPNPDTDTYSLR